MSTDIEPVDTALEPVNRQVSKTQFPDEIVAHVRAMTLLGYPADRTARELPLNFPGEERLPSRRTVSDWARELRQTATEEVRDEEVRIARRMDTITHTYIDKVENGDIKPSFSQVFLGWGLAHDKVRASSQTAPTSVSAQNVLIVVNAQKPDVIKGEVIDE